MYHTNKKNVHTLHTADETPQPLTLIQALLDSSPDGIIVFDDAENVIQYNEQFLQMWGLPEDIMQQKSPGIFAKMIEKIKLAEVFFNKLKLLENNPTQTLLEVIQINFDKFFECYSQAFAINSGVGRLWNFRDITRQLQMQQQLQFITTHDVLTKAANRNLLENQTEQAIVAAKRYRHFVGIFLIDLNRFKNINDSFGFMIGDKLLQIIADRLMPNVGSEDVLARLGSDKFVYLAKKIMRSDQAVNIADNLLNKVNQVFDIDNTEIVIAASIGISIYPRDGKSFLKLLHNADLAMCQAKQIGSSNFQFYKKEMELAAFEHLEKEMKLRKAIQNQEFVLYYQPQLNASNNEISAIEALLRWRQADNYIVLPNDFILMTERTGLIIPLGEWAIETACKQAKAWQDMGLRPIMMAVNVASQQFKDPGFVNFIKKTLEKIGLEPKYLEIEIKEDVIIESKEIITVIEALDLLGVKVTLDDFDTGNSCLHYLGRLPISKLKIDKSFVHNIHAELDDEVIIDTIISLAKKLHLNIVAEGVETKEQLQYLKERDCDKLQGYYFSEPLPAEQCIELLKKKHDK